jgi:hypothetical protein
MSFFMMMTENPQHPQQGAVPRGKEGFPSRLQSTARCSIGIVQSGRLFLESKAFVSDAAFERGTCALIFRYL